VVLKFPLFISVWIGVVLFNRSGVCHVQDIGQQLRFPYGTFFFKIKELLCVEMASQTATEMVSSPVLSSYALKHLVPNIPEWNNCQYMQLSVLLSTQ
jgi:hypothetical protein